VARWRKLLARMLSDSKPSTYTYSDAAAVLSALGFEVAPSSGGSHRKWRAQAPNGNAVIIGLVDKGYGTLKPYLVRDMIAQLRQSGFLATEPEPEDGMDD
jgi:predicted RNA binding protein YcfA (HicA-like mRNA interferase family)